MLIDVVLLVDGQEADAAKLEDACNTVLHEAQHPWPCQPLQVVSYLQRTIEGRNLEVLKIVSERVLRNTSVLRCQNAV